MTKLITKAVLDAGMGDALNARAFLIEYCKQKNIPQNKIVVYTNKYLWMFEETNFIKGTLFNRSFTNLTPFNNFGKYDIPKLIKNDKNDLCIAKNAGIDFSFDTTHLLPKYKNPSIKLPEKFITFNTGYGDLSGKSGNPAYMCTKAWPIEYWTKFVKLIGIPCVQVGSGLSCKVVEGTAKNLVNKLTIKESAEVMRKALFHVDIEGGLTALNQHLGKKSVVLFGPCAIENQGRSFNLNLRNTDCEPCYEWGTHKYGLCMLKEKVLCKAHCMTDLQPEYVVEQIYKSGWL